MLVGRKGVGWGQEREWGRNGKVKREKPIELEIKKKGGSTGCGR